MQRFLQQNTKGTNSERNIWEVGFQESPNLLLFKYLQMWGAGGRKEGGAIAHCGGKVH
jgi:hypothetical protein